MGIFIGGTPTQIDNIKKNLVTPYCCFNPSVKLKISKSRSSWDYMGFDPSIRDSIVYLIQINS